MYQVKLVPDRSQPAADFGSMAGVMAQFPRPDFRQTIGERCRLIRIAYGRVLNPSRPAEITQAEFSQLCGINRQAWNNVETGDSRLSIDSAIAVCRRTGASLDYIYLGIQVGLSHGLAVEIARLQSARAVRRA